MGNRNNLTAVRYTHVSMHTCVLLLLLFFVFTPAGFHFTSIVFFSVYRPDTDVTSSLHDRVDKLEKHLRYVRPRIGLVGHSSPALT